MSYPGDPPDDDFESGLDAITDPGLKKALGDYAARSTARSTRAENEIDIPQNALLDEYTKKLQERRSGPDFSERMYQLSAALMKPTTYQGFGATIGNVAPVLAEQRAAMREAEDAKQELLMKYKLQSQQFKGQQLKERYAAQDALDKLRLNAAISQFKVLNTPRWVQVPDGKGGMTLMQVTPNSLQPSAAVPPRPAGVPANWTFHRDAQGNGAYVSPDSKQYVEVQ